MVKVIQLASVKKFLKLLYGKSWFSLSSFIVVITTITIFYSSLSLCKNNKNFNKDDVNIVERFGLLQVDGTKIVDKDGNPVVLRGMSLFWSQWIGKYYNYDCIKWLRDDWKCTVIRAAMAVESGGYLTNPDAEKAKIKTVIDACIDLGIYVIVDWHDHNAHLHTNQAISFFKEIASEYGDVPNLIYEIYNEPTQVLWLNDVKPYADSVVKNIRAIDPDNLILVGSPTWSQDVDIAALNPLQFNNIAYTLHFYAATHKQSLRNKAATAMNRGVALFVSEFGTCESSGTGPINYTEVVNWFNFMEANKISWCNWSIADKDETSAALKAGASASGGWSSSDLSESGLLIRERIQTWNDSVFTSVNYNISSISLPMNFILHQNYPNPFNPGTTLEYVLLNDGYVKLEIFNVNGQRIITLINDYKNKGSYKINWNGYDDAGMKVSGGVYFFLFNFENQIRVKKGILLN